MQKSHNCSSTANLLNSASPRKEAELANLSPPPHAVLLSMMWYGEEYLFGQLGSAVPAGSPPIVLCTPRQFAAGAA